MTDVAAEIRKTINDVRGPQTMAQADEDFAKLRAHVRGTLIAAWRELVRDGEWLVTDDRILDIVTAWMEQKRR